MYTKIAKPNFVPLFEAETVIYHRVKNSPSKVVNLSSGEIKNNADFKPNRTWDRIILKAGN